MSLESTRRGFLAKVGTLPLLGIAYGARAADAWPNRPVKMLVSYPAGGANDLVARSVSTAMERALNATVIVDNRSGAAGVIGAEAAAKAPPDGYTLYMMSSAQVLAPSLRKTLPYDPVRDFTAIALSARSSYVLAVHPSVPLKTMAELIAYAKANPGKLNYASSGVGAGPHLATELFASMADVKLTHVPYRGDTPALTDLVAGQVQMSFMSMAPAVPHVKSGAIRALAVASAKRSADPAGRADGRRSRAAGIRCRLVVGVGCAGWHAARHHSARGERRRLLPARSIRPRRASSKWALSRASSARRRFSATSRRRKTSSPTS